MSTLMDITREKIGGFFFKPENQERRDARKIEAEVNKEFGLEKKEAEAEASGNVTAVVAYLTSINELERKEVKQLFGIFTDIRLLTLRHLNTVSGIEMDIRRDPKAKDKERLLLGLNTYKEQIGSSVNTLFQNMTSMDSANFSAKQHLQTYSTLVRDLFNAANSSRKKERKLKKTEQKVVSMAAKSTERLMREYGDDLKDELEVIATTAESAIAVLKKNKSRIQSHSDHIKELVLKAGFPPVIGKDLEEQHKKTLEFVDSSIKNEIAKERIEKSEVQRAA